MYYGDIRALDSTQILSVLFIEVAVYNHARKALSRSLSTGDLLAMSTTELRHSIELLVAQDSSLLSVKTCPSAKAAYVTLTTGLAVLKSDSLKHEAPLGVVPSCRTAAMADSFEFFKPWLVCIPLP